MSQLAATFLSFFALTFCIIEVSIAAKYEDERCICECKPLLALNIPRKVYQKDAIQENCNCLDIVISEIKETNGTMLAQYCLGCQCKYEVRSTKTMEVVVIMYIILLGIILAYMFFAFIIEYCDKKRVKKRDTERENLVEEETTSFSGPGTSRQRPYRHQRHTSSSSAVLQRLSSVRDEWQKQLKSQQDKVFQSRNILQ